MSRPLLLLAVLLAVSSVRAVAAETGASPHLTGSRFTSVWLADNYGASPINWRVLQHPHTGFIYVANNLGVLEFDGGTWRLIRLPRRSAVRSLLVDHRGVLWAAGTGELCTIEPDPVTGELRPIDQSYRVPALREDEAETPEPPEDTDNSIDPQRIGVVTRAAATAQGMYFNITGRIVRFGATGNVRTWPTGRRVVGFWAAGDELYLNDPVRGVLHVQQDELASLDTTRTPEIYAARPDAPPAETAAREPAGWTLLSARGPLRWAGPGTPLPKPGTMALEWLGDDALQCAAFLPDGRVAYGTSRGGLVITDAAGRLLQRIDRHHGLPVDRINSVCIDRHGGLWLAMHFGIARVQIDGPFATHGAAQGLEGGPREVQRAGGRLFVSHGEGLAWRDDTTGRFQSIDGFRSGTHHVQAVADRLVVTGVGIFELGAGNAARPIRYPVVHYAMHAPADPAGSLLVSTSTQIALWPSLDGFADRKRLPSVPSGANRLLPTRDGFVWAVLRTDEVWRIDARGGLTPSAAAQRFIPAPGVSPARRADGLTVVSIGPDLLAASTQWLLRFDPSHERFVPETRLGPLPPGGGPVAACATADGGGWFYFAGAEPRLAHVMPTGGGDWRVTSTSTHALSDLTINSLYFDEPTHTLWIAGQGVLVSFTPVAHVAAAPERVHVVIHHAEDSGGRVLIAPYTRGESSPVLALTATQTALRIAYGAPNFSPDYRGQVRTLYRTKLDGIDQHWTAWNAETKRDFTNLPPGHRVFRVQARDPSGRLAPEATLTLQLAPPWWRTSWAYAGYVFGAGLVMGGFVKLRTRTLRHRNAHLESVVAARTAELERLSQIDRDESAAARLAEEKTRLEMLRYQLNPHFLYNALNSIRALIFSRPPAAGDMVLQLADLCRVTLTRNEDLAPVSDEFAMLKLYLDMEKTRWRDKLSVEIDLAPDAATQAIPPFLLLPLVENALKHGWQPEVRTLRLRLSASLVRSGTRERFVPSDATLPPSDARPILVLEVANTGVWLAPGTSSAPSTGIGLENLRQRLRRYYPQGHTFTHTEHDGWVIVSLALTTIVDRKS